MRIKFGYSNKEFFLTPYNTLQEKELLLYTSLNEEFTLTDVLHTLSDNIDGDINDLSDEEIIVLLYKLRSISIGEEVSLQFKCTNIDCKAPNEQVLNISELVTSSNIDNLIFIDQFTTLTEDNFQNYINNITVDELDVDEYDNLYENLNKAITKFNFNKTRKCHKCGTEHVFDISNKKYVVENLSEDSLMSLYQTISDLVFFSHYTKYDVDHMIPFERSIFVGILTKTREDLNK